MNLIDPAKRALAKSIFLTGESTRYVAEVVGMDKNTAWTIQKQTWAEHGLVTCACGKIAGHRGWCEIRAARSPNMIASLVRQWRDITTVQIYVPTRPRYERPEIPNERETEIPLLVNRRNIRSLDAPVFDGDECGHTLFKSDTMNPLEILLLKEEQQSEEYLQRGRRISEWKRWRERKSSAFSIT
jgi:hypothetical protein